MDSIVIAQFDQAQRRAIALLTDVVSQLREGQTEVDIAALAQDRLQTFGFDSWYHPPEVRIGARINGRFPFRRSSSQVRLGAEDLVEIDLGPATADAFGDTGGTFSLGDALPPVVEVSRDCVKAICGFASRWKTTGELFVYAKAWAANYRLSLASERSIGHAVLPREGLLDNGWPRSAHWLTLLRRHQIHFLHPVRLNGLYAVRPKLTDGSMAASFEEMIVVTPDECRVLGRDSLQDVGRF
jgi:methionine aminopeptidase